MVPGYTRDVVCVRVFCGVRREGYAVYDIGVNSSYRGFAKAVFAGLEVAGGGVKWVLVWRRGFVFVAEGVKPGVNTAPSVPQGTSCLF